MFQFSSTRILPIVFDSRNHFGSRFLARQRIQASISIYVPGISATPVVIKACTTQVFVQQASGCPAGQARCAAF